MDLVEDCLATAIEAIELLSQVLDKVYFAVTILVQLVLVGVVVDELVVNKLAAGNVPIRRLVARILIDGC